MNYACINDAWGVDDKVKTKKTKEYNNHDSIIDSYLDDFINLKNNKNCKGGKSGKSGKNTTNSMESLKSPVLNPNTFDNDYKQEEHQTNINYNKPLDQNYIIEPYSKVINYMDYEDYFSNKNLFGKQKIKKKGMIIEEKSEDSNTSNKYPEEKNQTDYNVLEETSENERFHENNAVSSETYINDEYYKSFLNENEGDKNAIYDKYEYNYPADNNTVVGAETRNDFINQEMVNSEFNSMDNTMNNKINNTINNITKNPIIDVIIYTLMGIILIFMLEQIFKLGVMSVKL